VALLTRDLHPLHVVPCGVPLTHHPASSHHPSSPPPAVRQHAVAAHRLADPAHSLAGNAPHHARCSPDLALRRFVEAEKVARGPKMLNQATWRVVRPAGVSRSTVTRVGQKGRADARPASSDPERRASKRHLPVEELSRVRAAVYEQ